MPASRLLFYNAVAMLLHQAVGVGIAGWRHSGQSFFHLAPIDGRPPEPLKPGHFIAARNGILCVGTPASPLVLRT